RTSRRRGGWPQVARGTCLRGWLDARAHRPPNDAGSPRRPHSRPTCPGSSWLSALPLRTLRPLSCREHLPHEADQLPDGTEVCCGTGRDVLGAPHEVIVAPRRRRPKLDHEGTLRGEGHTCVRKRGGPAMSD